MQDAKLDTAALCNRCQANRSGQIRLDECVLLQQPFVSSGFYSVTLAPGEIRYLKGKLFVGVEVDNWIKLFKQLSERPEIEGLWGGKKDALDFVDTKKLFGDIAWEDTFRILHGFAVLHRDFGVPSSVYSCFHSALLLRSFEFAECVNSWVKEAWKEAFVTQTFVKSDEHLILECGDNSNDLAVFKMTPFVVNQLEAPRKLEEETK
ncbi:MAG: hypothetical protein M3Y82_14785 [Verrucomicrobiota bacterium]|nr:hypothetical protein [Verrucomicrobiota bacterium]